MVEGSVEAGGITHEWPVPHPPKHGESFLQEAPEKARAILRRMAFIHLWDTIHAGRSDLLYEANPPVWIVKYKLVEVLTERSGEVEALRR